eukprot:jgi/Chlat1/6158/Chrsp41S09034
MLRGCAYMLCGHGDDLLVAALQAAGRRPLPLSTQNQASNLTFLPTPTSPTMGSSARFEGKVFCGIGAVTAEHLAAQGAHVWIAARRKDRLETLRAKINTAGKGRGYSSPPSPVVDMDLDELAKTFNINLFSQAACMKVSRDKGCDKQELCAQ